ncbi:hypothetical protein HYW61_00270 [candidate division WWE3 bacterium]|nr:hypothetical protein [candidate division WWE3 bacterium]
MSDARKLRNVLNRIEDELRTAFEILERIQRQSGGQKDYSGVAGVEGVFDGESMTDAAGTKYEVPANYTAKSRLVCGDRLKMVEEDGRGLFKQTVRVEREKLEAVLNKKEGKWYALTEKGSFRISDAAAYFNKVNVGEKAVVIIPKGVAGAAFAALEKVLRDQVEKAVVEGLALQDEGTPKNRPTGRRPVPAAVTPAQSLSSRASASGLSSPPPVEPVKKKRKIVKVEAPAVEPKVEKASSTGISRVIEEDDLR